MFLSASPRSFEPQKRRRVLSDWLPLGAYGLFLFLQSAVPPVVREPLFPFADKAAHVLLYAVLGVLFYRAFKTPSVKSATAAVWAVFSSILYGIGDEIHQAVVPLRSAETGDILADALGSALGVLLFLIVFPAFRNAPDRPSIRSRGKIPD